MSPLDEARKNVKIVLKEIIRTRVYSCLDQIGTGYEEISDETIAYVTAHFDKIIELIEEQYLEFESLIKNDNTYARAHMYYSVFSTTLVNFIIGMSMSMDTRGN